MKQLNSNALVIPFLADLFVQLKCQHWQTQGSSVFAQLLIPTEVCHCPLALILVRSWSVSNPALPAIPHRWGQGGLPSEHRFGASPQRHSGRDLLLTDASGPPQDLPSASYRPTQWSCGGGCRWRGWWQSPHSYAAATWFPAPLLHFVT